MAHSYLTSNDRRLDNDCISCVDLAILRPLLSAGFDSGDADFEPGGFVLDSEAVGSDSGVVAVGSGFPEPLRMVANDCLVLVEVQPGEDLYI